MINEEAKEWHREMQKQNGKEVDLSLFVPRKVISDMENAAHDFGVDMGTIASMLLCLGWESIMKSIQGRIDRKQDFFKGSSMDN